MNFSTTQAAYLMTSQASSDVYDSTFYAHSVEATVLWSFLYIIMVVIGLFGNIGICWIIWFRKQMRTVTNHFLFSTAFADCNVIALNTVFNFTSVISGNRWDFGSGLCYFFNFVPIGAVCASIFTITAISIDRFNLVIFPMRQRISKRKAKLIIGSIWVISLIIAFPQCFWSLHTMEKGRLVCYVKWPNKAVGLSYQVLFICITYWLPLVVLAITYATMGVRLNNQSRNEMLNVNETMTRRRNKNKKAVKMMVLVVIVFALCWWPYQLFFLVNLIYPELSRWSGASTLYLGVFWLAMSHAMYNPIIYCWANPKFRKEFMSLVRSAHRMQHQRGLTNYSGGRSSSRIMADSRTEHVAISSM